MEKYLGHASGGHFVKSFSSFRERFIGWTVMPKGGLHER